MLFSSMIFLWLFLPCVLILNLILPRGAANWFLIAAGFIFYAWGEQEYIWVLLLSLLVNYLGARLMGKAGESRTQCPGYTFAILVLLLAFNLGLLGYFKYFDFITGLLGKLSGRQFMAPRNLLQMISYVIDVYRGDIPAETRLSHLALYISFFPKMIQGPIVRYGGFDACIHDRHVTPELFAYGARRFIYGLSKKLILANQFGSVVDKVLSHPMEEISGGLGLSLIHI